MSNRSRSNEEKLNQQTSSNKHNEGQPAGYEGNRDEKIKNEEDSLRLRSEKQSVIDGNKIREKRRK